METNHATAADPMGAERRKQVGTHLRALVAERGLTFAAFAKRCGCSAPDVAKYVGGLRPMPLVTCWRMAAELGVSADALCLEEARPDVDFDPEASSANAAHCVGDPFAGHLSVQWAAMRERFPGVVDAVGVSDETWRRWERAQGLPSLGQAIAACRFCGCSLAGVLPSSDKPPVMGPGPMLISATRAGGAFRPIVDGDASFDRLMDAWDGLDAGQRALLAKTARCWAGLSD